MAKLLVFGSTGYIGFIVTEHLGKAGLQPTAFVRNLNSDNQSCQAKLASLRQTGVYLLEGSLDADTDQLAATIRDYDIVLSFLKVDDPQSELKLLEACKAAGTVKRLFPSYWGGDFPLAGKYANPLVAAAMNRTRNKLVVLDAVRKSGIPYTIVINHLFHGWALPAFGTLTLPGTPSPKEATIYGDGDTAGYAVAEQDIGKVVVRALNDPRTVNKKLVIRSDSVTQNQLVAAYEAETGQKLARKIVTNKELEEQIKGAKGLQAFVHALHKSIWVDNVSAIPPEELTADSSVFATQLYPDIKYISIDDFYRSQG